MNAHAPAVEERALVGCILTSGDNFLEFQHRLDAEAFTDPHARQAFAACLAVAKTKPVVGRALVLTELVRTSLNIPEEGWDAWLSAAGEMGRGRKQMASLFGHVADRQAARNLAAAALEAQVEVAQYQHGEPGEFERVREACAGHFMRAADPDAATEPTFSGDFATELQAMLDPAMAEEVQRANIRTGFTDLDSMIEGLQKKRLGILAARPGVGKTLVGLQFALNASTQGHSAIFFSCEMSAQEMTLRCMSNISRVSYSRLSRCELTDDDRDRLLSCARDNHAASKLTIVEKPRATLSYIRSRIHRYEHEFGAMPDMIVVDYIGVMTYEGKEDQHRLKIAAIVQGLKAMAMQLEIAVVALAQINRAGAADPEPQIHHIAESTSIEMEADVVMLLSDVLNGDGQRTGLLKLNVAKCRYASSGSTQLSVSYPYFQARQAAAENTLPGGHRMESL